MLQFEASWRFTSPGPIPREVVHDFRDFIEKIADQSDAWTIAEKFKYYFSGGMGHSSSLDWAWTDLDRCMAHAAENAPVFIESFFKGCSDCHESGLAVPDLNLINNVLAKHKAGYELRLPFLVATTGYTPIAVPQKAPSLAAQAQAMIAESVASAERFLDEGRGRQAVSELLWLLESVLTAFRGTGAAEDTVQGKYFNTIVRDMKASNRGKALEQALKWMETLHGYLSSPTGGGVRHGTDLKAGIAIQPHEARLYCNLIRSYLTFMIEEHERQTTAAVA